MFNSCQRIELVPNWPESFEPGIQLPITLIPVEFVLNLWAESKYKCVASSTLNTATFAVSSWFLKIIAWFWAPCSLNAPVAFTISELVPLWKICRSWLVPKVNLELSFGIKISSADPILKHSTLSTSKPIELLVENKNGSVVLSDAGLFIDKFLLFEPNAALKLAITASVPEPSTSTPLAVVSNFRLLLWYNSTAPSSIHLIYVSSLPWFTILIPSDLI